MNNETCTVTIADIYGAEWWERNKAELDREWEWEFRLVQPKEHYAIRLNRGITMSGHNEDGFPRIILHRRKPKTPTLREVYEVDEVTVPIGKEWTGEWRETTSKEANAGLYVKVPLDRFRNGTDFPCHRLILRERPKKVWFKAEDGARQGVLGDWVWMDSKWVQLHGRSGYTYLCATRHEEVDDTVQVVTQADVDKVVK